MSLVDASARLSRSVLSLHGVAIGDGLGESMFGRVEQSYDAITNDRLPSGPWWHTDDTEMAISVVSVLRMHGSVDQDILAKYFIDRFVQSPNRGYGSGARRQLQMMLDGVDWATASREAFSGQGSLGNGSAMRAAPLGGWYAETISTVSQPKRDYRLW